MIGPNVPNHMQFGGLKYFPKNIWKNKIDLILHRQIVVWVAPILIRGGTIIIDVMMLELGMMVRRGMMMVFAVMPAMIMSMALN